MGQYYIPTLRKDKGKKYYVYLSHHYDNGLKLMEHSYFDNRFVEVIVNRLIDNPMRVAWVGDYADRRDLSINKEAVDLLEFIKQGQSNEDYIKGLKNGERSVNLIMVNHSKKAYIILNKYYNKNVALDEFCVHPLPLLTAVGNGKGGGDYYGNKPDFEMVGLWAGDIIEFVRELDDIKEKDYIDATNYFSFKED